MNWNFLYKNYFWVFSILLLSIGDQGSGQVELRYGQNETVNWEEATYKRYPVYRSNH